MEANILTINGVKYEIKEAYLKKNISKQECKLWNLKTGYWIIHIQTLNGIIHLSPLRLIDSINLIEIQNSYFNSEDERWLIGHDIYLNEWSRALPHSLSLKFGEFDVTNNVINIEGIGTFEVDEEPTYINYTFSGIFRFDGIFFHDFSEEEIRDFYLTFPQL